MRILIGKLADKGVRDFHRRMTTFPSAFEAATGEKLFPGTLNVEVGEPVPPVEHFRLRGTELDEPDQDLLFEVCRVNGLWAYRIRPFNIKNGGGGHGDHILEIACTQQLAPTVGTGPITIALFRDASGPMKSWVRA